MKRRTFLKNSVILSSFSPFAGACAFSKKTSMTYLQPQIAQFTIGQIKCTIFQDLLFKYQAKDYFINANSKELRTKLNQYQINPENIPSPFVAMLLENGNKKILIDSGIGFLNKPLIFRDKKYVFKGQLQGLLKESNLAKEDITDVIITHFHPDHIGGVFAESGALNFPKAKFHVHEAEWNYWHSTKANNQPPLFHYFVEKNIRPLKERNLNLIKGDFVEILPNITAIKAIGHTTGQIALAIESQRESVLYISDAFLHPLHIQHLNWQTNYDLDHDLAKKTRIKLLDLAKKENMLVQAFHFDFPGLGRVEHTKNNWHWNFLKA